ncbi:MAG TPA: prepilin-type N-terminal cleavage/methylation domain-containing protein [Myxococcota bacterium]|nr:prepilin-type N-terminal cleavage/methylation domain-containing protein [Myxococcota bacterium]
MRRVVRSRAQGFTLLELIIAVVILGIVVSATLESMSRQQKTSVVTEEVVEVQQNVRAIGSLLEREIRMAGFMVPDSAGVCGLDRTNGPDELFLSETDPIVPDDERSGDLGARVTGGWAVGNATPWSVSFTLDPSTSDLDDDGSWFYDNDGNGSPEADFRVGGGFILGDLANPDRGAACGTVATATATVLTGTMVSGDLVPFNAATHAPEEIVIVPAAYYRVDPGSTTGRLERNGDLLANGIDDLQIAYFFDGNDDGTATAAELPGSGETGAIVYDPAGLDHSTLKEVRFSLVVRTRATDSLFDEGSFVALENRTPPGGGNDGFRRRVLVGTVRPRNIGATGSI